MGSKTGFGISGRGSWHVGRRTALLRGPALLLGVLLLVAAPLRADNAELARFLLEHGRDDLKARAYDDALEKLEKARQEDPALIEATYWIAVTHEGKDCNVMAIAEYRAFLAATASDDAAGRLSRELASLRSKAKRRLASLDAAGLAVDEATTEAADRLYECAQEHRIDDPGLAERALRLALAVAPDHAGAKALLASLTAPEDDEPDAENPLARVRKWTDLVKCSFFGRNDGWTSVGSSLDIVGSRGQVVTPPENFTTGNAFAYGGDFRLDAVTAPGRFYSAGLVFGLRGSKALAVLLLEDRVALDAIDLATNGSNKLVVKPCEPWAPGTTRSVVLLVEGPHVEVRLGGEVVFALDVEDRDGLDGCIGLLYENVNLHVTNLRQGPLEEAGD